MKTIQYYKDKLKAYSERPNGVYVYRKLAAMPAHEAIALIDWAEHEVIKQKKQNS